MRIGVSPLAQKTQACEQPLYGLIVQRNGTWLISGTRFRADFARTSKNLTPIASGASKWRTTAGSEYPGRRSSSSAVIFRLSQRIRTDVRISPRRMRRFGYRRAVPGRRQQFVPALRFDALTRVYDPVIAIT